MFPLCQLKCSAGGDHRLIPMQTRCCNADMCQAGTDNWKVVQNRSLWESQAGTGRDGPRLELTSHRVFPDWVRTDDVRIGHLQVE